MSTDYLSFLQQQASSNFKAISSGNHYVVPLTNYGVINVTGEEASGFLQNLLTNDVNQLTQQTSQVTAMCNPKGRLLALFLLIKTENGFQLVLPKSQCAFLTQRLQMFKLRTKVEIVDCSDELNVCGLLGNTTLASAIHLPSQSRSLLIASTEQLSDEITQLLEQNWQLAPEANWLIADIEAGIPAIYPESRELFTAQQVNLDLIGGVSFRKGCYPGQEVVARLHYLGEPKRRLFHALTNVNELPTIGETVVDKESAVIGHIVNAIAGENDQVFLQLSLKLGGKDLDLFLNDGTAVEQLKPSAPVE